MRFTHASTFSGIGGPEVAASMLGWENLFHCEINPFGRAVLDYWYPNSKSYEDITKTDFTEWKGRVTVLTGGFPCQPFSYAGKRGGAEDDRYLWPYMLRCIEQVQPDWFVGENVAGITTMVEPGETVEVGRETSLFGAQDDVHHLHQRQPYTIERICRELEGIRYSVQPLLIPACAVGAPHRRDRIFFVARRDAAHNANSGAGQRTTREDEGASGAQRIQERHEIQLTDEPSEIRPAMQRDATPHPTGSGARTPRESGSSQSERSGQNQQQELRGATTQRNHRLHELLRDAADTTEQQGRQLQSEQSCDSESEQEQFRGRGCKNGDKRNAADTCHSGLQEERTEQSAAGTRGYDIRNSEWHKELQGGYELGTRWRDFPTVSPVHRGNDGIPFPVDRLTISFARWRTESLKAYGNAIVPQVMYEIFRAIQQVMLSEE